MVQGSHHEIAMLSRQTRIHKRWNANNTNFHVISVGNFNFTVAHVQLAETLRFGIGCMEDDHMVHFASFETHDQNKMMDSRYFSEIQSTLSLGFQRYACLNHLLSVSPYRKI
jgi:hypothetical protein